MISFILSWYRLLWGIKEVRDGAGESVEGGMKTNIFIKKDGKKMYNK
jgi:hypothetical protein